MVLAATRGGCSTWWWFVPSPGPGALHGSNANVAQCVPLKAAREAAAFALRCGTALTAFLIFPSMSDAIKGGVCLPLKTKCSSDF